MQDIMKYAESYSNFEEISREIVECHEIKWYLPDIAKLDSSPSLAGWVALFRLIQPPPITLTHPGKFISQL